MKILDFSYPKSESKKEIIISSLLIGVFTYFFLLVFQPFGTHHIPFQKLTYLLFPYAVFTTITFFAINLYLSKKQVRWNIIQEILKLILIVFACSVLSYFYNTLLISKVKISFTNFLYIVLYAISIAIPICTIYVLTRFIYLNKANQNNAEKISERLDISKDNYQAENQIIQLSINKQFFNEVNLVLVESTDNYCTIYILENLKVEKYILRTTLKSIEEQIKSKKILRCHRSYIVNLEKIKSLNGNAQGYKLTLDNIDFVVPVSRKYLQTFNKTFKQ